ncbi:MAG: DUF2269 family protein [Nitrospirota bacterium]
MTYSLLRFVHLVGVMLMGAGLIGVWLSDLRSRKVRDLALFAEAVRNIAVFYDGVVVHGAVIRFMSGVWMTALHAPPPPHEQSAGPGRRDAGAHPRQASTDPDLHALPSPDYSQTLLLPGPIATAMRNGRPDYAVGHPLHSRSNGSPACSPLSRSTY